MGAWLFYQYAAWRAGVPKVGSQHCYQRLAEKQGIQGPLCKSHGTALLPTSHLLSRQLLSTARVSRVRHLGSRHPHHFNPNQSGTLFVQAGCFLQIKSKWFVASICDPGRIISVKAKGTKLIDWSAQPGNNLSCEGLSSR